MNDANLSTLLGVDKDAHIPRYEMNKLVMNYLVTEGFKEAAEKFRIETGVQPGIDLDSLDNRIQIREAILAGKIEESVTLINNLFPELLENDRLLFFHLQQQHLIELIRHKKVDTALDFAQTHLASQGESSAEILSELERTMALLAFDEPDTSPFGDLMHSSQRHKVAGDVNAAILENDAKPKLESLVRLLHWSQSELENKKVKFAKVTDVSRGIVQPPSTL